MNPLELITNTLVTSASLAQQEMLAPPAMDQYLALTTLLANRHPTIDLTRIQAQPESTRGRDYLLEDLADANAAQDADLLAATLTLLGALHDQTDAAATLPQSIGVDLDNIVAAGLKIFDVVSDDVAVRIRNSEFLGPMHIGRVVAGEADEGEGGRSGAIQMKDVPIVQAVPLGCCVYKSQR